VDADSGPTTARPPDFAATGNRHQEHIMTLHTTSATLVALVALASPAGATPTHPWPDPPPTAGTADTAGRTAGLSLRTELGALQEAYRAAPWTTRAGIHNEIVLLVNVATSVW
jgi:hypothetical protein